jgi:1-acyl-sn-glycerol-3-phosphate acyltransferase
MTFLRSLLFNVAFYLATILILIFGAPGFLLSSERGATEIVRFWGRLGVAMLRVIAGTRCEVRGRENIPTGGCLVAAKHQSMFETFALLPLVPYPTFVIKRELRSIPLFGRYTVVTGMIHVDRDKGPSALRALAVRARQELAKDRQIIIFPEGTRRPPGAPPDYQTGIGLLYRTLNVPVVPVAVNSGLYWPRRKFLRYPGTIVVEFLPPIPPGLGTKEFLDRLEAAIESASDRLLIEANSARPRPPFPAEATARLATLAAE